MVSPAAQRGSFGFAQGTRGVLANCNPWNFSKPESTSASQPDLVSLLAKNVSGLCKIESSCTFGKGMLQHKHIIVKMSTHYNRSHYLKVDHFSCTHPFVVMLHMGGESTAVLVNDGIGHMPHKLCLPTQRGSQVFEEASEVSTVVNCTDN